MPIEFNHRAVIPFLEIMSEPERHDRGNAVLVRQQVEGWKIQMVVVIVRNHDNVDRWQVSG